MKTILVTTLEKLMKMTLLNKPMADHYSFCLEHVREIVMGRGASRRYRRGDRWIDEPSRSNVSAEGRVAHVSFM